MTRQLSGFAKRMKEAQRQELVRKAAPDLLKALKDMVRYLDNNGKETDVSELTRAAIAKAEGGAE